MGETRTDGAVVAEDGAPGTHRAFTRRTALAGAGVLAVGGGAWAAHEAITGPTPTPGVSPSSPTVLAADPVLHLIRRVTFGLTPGLAEEVAAQGAGAWLDDQLHPERIDDAELDALLAAYPLLTKTAAELDRELPDDARLTAAYQLIDATLARQIWSRRQLAEVMVDFWSNHFNVTTPGLLTATTKPVEDATVIRRLALSSFDELLLADGSSPGMLLHLGNATSSGDDPNENYGRELLELHTVGIDAGYTEQDVRDSAYILTGWGVGDDGTFLFTPEDHYTGPVTVLGWSATNDSAGDGLAVGRDYLHYLAHHEQTARHLSRKLAIRFVSDTPSDALVDDLARVYTDNDTAVLPWLQALFSSREFAASVGQKVRRPVDDLVAAVRALGVGPPTPDPAAMAALSFRSRQLGQQPLGAAPPTGYPDVAAAWLSTSGSLGRWNVHRKLTARSLGKLDYPDLRAVTGAAGSATMGELVDRVTRALTGQVFRDDHRTVLLNFLGADDRSAYDDKAATAVLPDLVALTLDSPYHLMR